MRTKVFWLLVLLAVVSLSVGSIAAQTGVTAVVTNEYGNIRIVPALGAEVIASVPAGFYMETVTGRSPDDIWLRIDFNGNEGWIHTSTLSVLTGDIRTLPVADPRSIPYGGFETPRAGTTSVTSDVLGRATDWLRLRAGPSTGYPILANIPIDELVSLLGRTANSGWLQVSWQGTLGWVSSRYIQPPPNVGFASLPVDGILAEGSIDSAGTAENFLGALQLMRDRLDLAQPSLDDMRARWTDTALTGRAACNRPYPAQPSNFNIPNPLLAAYYNQLNPLIILFNDAMYNVRYSIDLFIQACNQAGPVNPVGEAWTMGALDTIALADSQFAELRRMLAELIPPPADLGAGECLFSFANQVDILPVITIQQLLIQGLDARQRARGYCIDLTEGDTVILEVLRLPGASIEPLISLSPIDNPTAFLATGRSTLTDEIPNLVVGPVQIPATGRYIIILSHTGDVPPMGEFAIYVNVPDAFIAGGSLAIDPVTGEVIVNAPALAPVVIGTSVGTGCPNVTLSCTQLAGLAGATCDTALACLAAGNFSLDPDLDGVPCEAVLCSATP